MFLYLTTKGLIKNNMVSVYINNLETWDLNVAEFSKGIGSVNS